MRSVVVPEMVRSNVTVALLVWPAPLPAAVPLKVTAALADVMEEEAIARPNTASQTRMVIAGARRNEIFIMLTYSFTDTLTVRCGRVAIATPRHLVCTSLLAGRMPKNTRLQR